MVSSSIVDKYIGESARLIREMFNYARDHQPCIIFMDEIDAIGKPGWFSESAFQPFLVSKHAREVQGPLTGSSSCCFWILIDLSPEVQLADCWTHGGPLP